MEQDIQREEELDAMLKELYVGASVPKDINIRLHNQIKCKEAMKEADVSVWWLPASLNTVFAVFGAVILILFYYIVNLAGVDSTMPNLLRFVTGCFMKVQLVLIAGQVVIGWFLTFVSLWKLNFYQSAKL